VHRTRCTLILDIPKTEIRFERERINDGIALSHQRYRLAPRL